MGEDRDRAAPRHPLLASSAKVVGGLGALMVAGTVQTWFDQTFESSSDPSLWWLVLGGVLLMVGAVVVLVRIGQPVWAVFGSVLGALVLLAALFVGPR